MIGFIVYVIFHMAMLFCSIVASKVMCDRDIIDDDEFYNIVAIFVPWAVLIWLCAVYVGERVSDSLT